MIYAQFETARQQKQKRFALLIDPDNVDSSHLMRLKSYINKSHIDFFFLGGSLVQHDNLEKCIRFIRKYFTIPVVLFPGDHYQITPLADAILFLSLISGRNPDLLIGKQVLAAPHLRRSGIEVVPTGYLLIDGGRPTTVSYMSQTLPIPHDKPEIAVSTALAGEMLGLKLIFLDAGSGAGVSVSEEMVRQVKKEIDVPLVVGGGIRDGNTARRICEAGADVIVVGNAIEEDPQRIIEISAAVQSFNSINELS